MPSLTAERPHATTCIKWSVQDLLREHSDDDLTISCDRDDCWCDSELFKHRQAINIVTSGEILGDEYNSAQEARKLGQPRTEADDSCVYKTTLDVDIQIYVEQCDCDDDDECRCFTAKDKAYSVLAHVQSVLFQNQSQLAGHRIYYTGSNPSTESDNELDVAVVVGRFQIMYLFDPAQPWAVQ